MVGYGVVIGLGSRKSGSGGVKEVGGGRVGGGGVKGVGVVGVKGVGGCGGQGRGRFRRHTQHMPPYGPKFL